MSEHIIKEKEQIIIHLNKFTNIVNVNKKNLLFLYNLRIEISLYLVYYVNR